MAGVRGWNSWPEIMARNPGFAKNAPFVIADAHAVAAPIPGSSVVEQPAVNRLVAGSNPARGAKQNQRLTANFSQLVRASVRFWQHLWQQFADFVRRSFEAPRSDVLDAWRARVEASACRGQHCTRQGPIATDAAQAWRIRSGPGHGRTDGVRRLARLLDLLWRSLLDRWRGRLLGRQILDTH